MDNILVLGTGIAIVAILSWAMVEIVSRALDFRLKLEKIRHGMNPDAERIMEKEVIDYTGRQQ